MTEPVVTTYLRAMLYEAHKAIADMWEAHGVMLSNGVTAGTFKRHMEPALYEAVKLLPEDMRRNGMPKTEAEKPAEPFEDLLG